MMLSHLYGIKIIVD